MTDERRQMMEQVQGVVRDILLNDTLVITEDTRLAEIPEWDSMLHVTLLMSIERKFGVRLTAREAAESTAIRPLLDVLSAKAGAKSPRAS